VGDKRIEKLFSENDTDHDDMLTLDDFLRFYRISSMSKSEVVWGNLQAFGYNHDLTRDMRGEVTYSDDTNLTVS
jgi:Ca2+-binding EF-hand superfamily protein